MRHTLLPILQLGTVALATAAEPLDRFKPKEPTPLAKKKEEAREVEDSRKPQKEAQDVKTKLKLRGLSFVASKAELRGGRGRAFDGVRVSGVPLLEDPRFSALISKFIGRPISLGLVNEVAAETARWFKKQDRPVVSVVAPPQDVTGGVIRYLVTEARLGEVRVVGNRHFATSLFRTGLSPGDPLRMSTLERETAFYDRNPFRSVTAELSPGKHSGETDVTLRVQDQRPFRVFAGYDNSGVKSTGENRVFTGFNYGNLFGLGQEISYQFSASDDFQRLLAHSATWTIPLPWMHILQFSGTYSESHPELGSGLTMDGTSWQFGARYIIPLRSVGAYKHELALGYDFKGTDNNLQFGGTQIFATPVEISQFSLGYTASLRDKWGGTGLSLTGYWSPGGMGGHNNDTDFAAARTGAKADYFYATLKLDRITKLPLGITWSLSAKGQIASGNLQGTEQFILGGQSTVRGYSELIALGDEGILIRNELYSPSFSLTRGKLGDAFQVLAFCDYGLVSLRHPLAGEDKNTQLASIGVGARWQLRQNVSAYFDYGWQLERIGADHSRAHAGVTVSY